MSGHQAEVLLERPSIGGAAACPRSLDYLQRYARSIERVERNVPDADHVFQQERKNLELYHCNGLSALRAIVLAMITNDVDRPRSFMDFGCAYGRVLRYFAAAFPESELTACDVREAAIAYCAETFGATPALSSADLPSILFPRQHDVIWMGSVITHFSAENSKLLLWKMLDNLNPGGLLVFSLHGRVYPLEVQPKRWKILGDDDFAIASDEYRRTGFGYRDYPGRPGIGASLTSPSWVFDLVREDSDLAFSYQERAWMGWHDVATIKKGGQRSIFSTYKDRAY
jgi:SAM-dependent methyltransferase